MSLAYFQKDPSRNSQSRILILLFGAIGDVVRGLSLAARIKNHYPEVELIWGVEKTSSALLKDHPSINQLLVFDRKEGLKGYFSFIKKIRSLKCDVVLDLSRHLKGGVCSYFSGSSVRVGFNKENSREFNWLFQTDQIEPVPHFSDKIGHYQKFADYLGVPQDAHINFGFSPRKEEVESLEQKISKISQETYCPFPEPERRVLFFIASTWRSREWPSEHFASLAKILIQQHGMIPVLVGGPGDASKGSEIKTLLHKDTPLLDLIGKTTLRELVVLCGQSFCGVGVDSGPMHIASAVGLKVISLWGPTNPERSTPFGNKDRILQSPLGCAPCYFRECPGLNTLCLKNITPEIVNYKFQELIKG